MTLIAPWDPALLDGVAAPPTGETATKYRDESEYTVRAHEDFLDWFLEDATPVALRKRARYCLRELLVSGACARRKNVQGAAKGWVRTQLGGTGGSHFYLWWAPHGYPAVDGTALEPGEILARVVRHHDDTDKPLEPGDEDLWHVLDAGMVHDASDTELNAEQEKVAAPAGSPIRIVRGYPGSGKTTALHHAGSYIWGDRALYLTFSNRLARASEQYFRSFAPQGTVVDCLPFAELVAELQAGPAASTIVRPHDGRELAELLKPVAAHLGPWKKRPHELFAELHAHAVGRAIPVEFRGLPAAPGPVVAADALVADRSESIGESGAERLAFVAGHLAEHELLDALFPPLVAARRLVDTSGEALPTRFDDVAAVFVDEVQDLTVVEAMLMLTVVARIGAATGQMPKLIIAGDEAQTVRPTAFEWSWLNDLITLVLGASPADREDIALTTNMRAPRAISRLIEATRSHYKVLEKDRRPAGLTYTEPDSDTDGKVLYCHVSDGDGWSVVEQLFTQHVSAQLVYPGPSVPDDYVGDTADVAASEQVKGLDFDLVGVVGAGARQLEIEALAEKAEQDRLAGALGRTIADQFRVAVSRSRENLLLLDRGPDDLLHAIRSLMAEAEPDPVLAVGVGDLREELEDDANPIDRLDSHLEAVREILETDPERALLKARVAAEHLRHMLDAADVPAPMVRDTARLAGIAAALVARIRTEAGAMTEAATLYAEASSAFSQAELGQVFEELRAFVDAAELGPIADVEPVTVLAAARAHPTVFGELGPLEPELRRGLEGWLEQVAELGMSYDEGRLDPSLTASEAIVELFPSRPEFAASRREALLRTAEVAEGDGTPEVALRCYEELEEPRTQDIGRCLEELGRWAEAADLYEEAGESLSVLRCVRRIPDIDRALELAPQFEPESVGRLRWAKSLLEQVDPAYTDAGAALTEEERAFLVDALSTGLARAVDSVPGPDALVDDVVSAPEPVTPAPVEPPAEIDDEEPIAPPANDREPVPETTSPVATDGELVALGSACAELGIDVAAGLAVCKKLGIRLVGATNTMTASQADRLRRRVASHGAG